MVKPSLKEYIYIYIYICIIYLQIYIYLPVYINMYIYIHIKGTELDTKHLNQRNGDLINQQTN